MTQVSWRKGVAAGAGPTCPPRLRRWALGTTSFISLANWVSRVLGSLDVVTSTCAQLAFKLTT